MMISWNLSLHEADLEYSGKSLGEHPFLSGLRNLRFWGFLGGCGCGIIGEAFFFVLGVGWGIIDEAFFFRH